MWLPRTVSWLARTPLDGVRWSVLDCESSGLDPARDRLLSVGAVHVRGGRIELASAYAAHVHQAQPSDPANIVVHGIGADAQAAGRPVEEIREALSAFLGDSVPVAFHAGFDARLLRRHGVKPARPWLDVALLAPALFPADGVHLHALDEWLARFAIVPEARHQAIGDAYATAQLLLVLLAEARRQGATTLERVLAAAREGRWLSRR